MKAKSNNKKYTANTDDLENTSDLYTAIGRRIPASVSCFVAQRPFLILVLRTGLIVAVFVLLDRFVMGVTHLPVSRFREPVLMLELVKSIGLAKLLILAAIGLVFLKHGHLLDRWKSLDHGRTVRWFVIFLALLMTWPFTTYGYNYYFDQGHFLDRGVLAVLLVLLWFRPVFIYPFLLLAFTLMWQFATPGLGGVVLAHKLQVLQVLNLFAAAFLLHSFSGKREMQGFVFLTCCMIAGSYWEAAIAKLELGWLTYGHLYRTVLAAYGHGWLGSMSPPTIVDFSQLLSRLDWPIRIFVLVIEAGFLVFLWRRVVSIVLLVAIIVFHCAVFVLYGFLFWTWILLDVALLMLLVYERHAADLQLFDRRRLALSIPLIVLAAVWARLPHLGWLDMPVSYATRYTVIGESGKQYSLSPRFFEPYGDVFTMSSFGYLVKDHGVLTGPYGVTRDIELADRMSGNITAKDVFAMESNTDMNRYDPDRAKRYYDFVSAYLHHWNMHAGEKPDLSVVGPPPQFWTTVTGESYVGQEPVRELVVNEVTTLFDGKRLDVIRDQELARIQIPTAAMDTAK